MKKLIYTIPLLFLMALVGCSSDDNVVDEVGYLQLSAVEIDKNITPTSRAASTFDDAQVMALDILSGSEVVKHVDDWTQLAETPIELSVGEYIVRAYPKGTNAPKQGVGIDPYYLGQTKVLIKKGEIQAININCTLAQSMVSFSYSDKFKAAFPTYSAELSNSVWTVTVPSTETRPAYMVSGVELTAALTVTNTSGETNTLSRKIADVAKERYHYKVRYDLSDNGGTSGDFTIEVDDVSKEFLVNVKIPFKPKAEGTFQTGASNPWGKFAYMTGTATLDGETDPVVFKYRKQGEEEWTTIASELKDSNYEAKTNEISFATTYEYAIACGSKMGEVKTFTTESFEIIPNLNFDTWTQSGKNWFANADDSDSYWASGNRGATTLKNANTSPTDDAVKGKAAKIETISMLMVDYAAGNLYIGEFAENISTSDPESNVTFGRKYNGARPVALAGKYKYTSKPISNQKKAKVPSDRTLTSDECHIYIKLWDANNKEIGYGEFFSNQTISNYVDFNIDINYSDVVSKPAKIAIVTTSSRYGGVFAKTGFFGKSVVGQVGEGSTLFVDEFQLSYYK